MASKMATKTLNAERKKNKNFYLKLCPQFNTKLYFDLTSSMAGHRVSLAMSVAEVQTS